MEENRRFSLSDLLIKIILVIVFVLFAVWLLSLSNKKMTNSLEVLTDRIFVENMEKMKEVGKEYFTIERLPEKVGEMEVLTLEKMYEKKLLLELKDKNGNACSAKDSYISIEKYDNEYQMKVYLECGKESDYIIVIMGCYDYCDTDICEREEQPVEDEEYVKGEVEGIEYEYKKTTGGHWTDYGSWSEWSKVEVTKTDYRQVETKKVTEDYTYDKTITETLFEDVIATCPEGYKKTADGTKCYKEITTTTTANPNACSSKDGDYILVSQNGFECIYSKTISSSVKPNACPQKDGDYILVSQNGFTCNYSKTTTVTADPVCPTKSGWNVSRDGFICNYSKSSTVTADPVCPTKSGWDVSRDGFICNYSKKVSIKHTETKDKYCPSDKDVFTCEGCPPVTQTIYVKCGVDTKIWYETKTEEDTSAAECPSGYKESGSKCVKTKPDNITEIAKCPKGFDELGNTCVRTEPDNITKSASCPSGYNKSGSKCVKTEPDNIIKTAKCPSGYDKSGNGCVKINTTYEYEELNKSCPANYTITSDNTKCYQEIDKVVSMTEKREVTYYRYRIREYIGGTVDYKWSTSKNDKKLLDAGYKLTGRTR